MLVEVGAGILRVAHVPGADELLLGTAGAAPERDQVLVLGAAAKILSELRATGARIREAVGMELQGCARAAAGLLINRSSNAFRRWRRKTISEPVFSSAPDRMSVSARAVTVPPLPNAIVNFSF